MTEEALQEGLFFFKADMNVDVGIVSVEEDNVTLENKSHFFVKFDNGHYASFQESPEEIGFFKAVDYDFHIVVMYRMDRGEQFDKVIYLGLNVLHTVFAV